MLAGSCVKKEGCSSKGAVVPKVVPPCSQVGGSSRPDPACTLPPAGGGTLRLLSPEDAALVQRFDPAAPLDTIGFFIAKFQKTESCLGAAGAAGTGQQQGRQDAGPA